MSHSANDGRRGVEHCGSVRALALVADSLGSSPNLNFLSLGFPICEMGIMTVLICRWFNKLVCVTCSEQGLTDGGAKQCYSCEPWGLLRGPESVATAP